MESSRPPSDPPPPPVRPAVEEGFAEGAGARLFYRSQGCGDPLVLLHGFPDDHRTWDPLVPTLAGRFRVVRPDLRGYGQSDHPRGVAEYRMEKLVGDVVGLLDHLGEPRAALIGHDWGAVVAQHVAVAHPHRVSRLVMLNIPHLSGLLRELATNRRQQAASWYARLFQDGQIDGPLSASLLLRQVRDAMNAPHAVDVLRRSSIAGLLDYYRANYPRPPYGFVDDAPRRNIRVPAQILFGLRDPYVLADCLRDNERWFDAGLEVVRIPRAGHWVHYDATEVVLTSLLRWLDRADL